MRSEVGAVERCLPLPSVVHGSIPSLPMSAELIGSLSGSEGFLDCRFFVPSFKWTLTNSYLLELCSMGHKWTVIAAARCAFTCFQFDPVELCHAILAVVISDDE